jgi:LmbE family N-acetylglucosaminyl deacetylase
MSDESLEVDIKLNTRVLDIFRYLTLTPWYALGEFVDNSIENQLKVINIIRKYQPDIVITNAPKDRHPDHGNSAILVKESAFKAGLKNIETRDEEGNLQSHWRPQRVLQMIQYQLLTPDFIVDISNFVDVKMESVMAYASQFYNPNSIEEETLIASKTFIENTKARHYSMGNYGLIPSAEGFISEFLPTTRNLYHII